jgi:Na+/H+ antiporter NhaD/arsenite permease-like protein
VDVLSLVLFVLTYVGLALGRIPGLALDRTGFALLGAFAFLATGRMTLDEAKEAVDAPTIAVLFGMMLLSAQYQVAGLYGRVVDRLSRAARPRRLLGGVILAAALLSAILTNDVVCFALTPLLCAVLLRTTLDPRPFLFALACATNVGSALTPIGNPQNILIAQSRDLAFAPFVLYCAAPVVLGLVFLHLFLARRVPADRALDAAALPSEPAPLDRPEAWKALLLTAATIVLFLTPVPAWLTALAVSGVVLTSRKMHTRRMLAYVDWHMLALFVGLFIVVRGFERSGWVAAAGDAVAGAGLDLAHPALLVAVAALLSNAVSNVPAVMLLLPLLPAGEGTAYGLALASTFAGNAILVGSIANVIVADQAQRLGIPFGFRDHAKVGLPVTLVTLALTVLLLYAT